MYTLLPFRSLSRREFRVPRKSTKLKIGNMLYMRKTDLFLFVCYGYDFVL